MAEALAVIGTAGAVVSLIDAIGKTMIKTRALYDEWRDADASLLSLNSQLIILRVTLSRIQSWVNSDTHEAHHQLVMDLNTSIHCCEVLVGKIDALVAGLHRTPADSNLGLDFSSKVKLMYGSK